MKNTNSILLTTLPVKAVNNGKVGKEKKYAMIDSQETFTKVFIWRKLIKSFFIGAGIYFATFLVFGRADGGIFSMLISPFLCFYNTAKLFIFTIIAGIGLYNKYLNKIWFRKEQVYKIVMVIGLLCFLIGFICAEHAYYQLNDQNTAQNYYNYVINPGFVIFLFSLCFRPINKSVY